MGDRVIGSRSGEPAPDRTGADVTGTGRTGKPLFILWSNDYASGRLASDYGRLPHSMLPLGGRRLYEVQCDFASTLDARTILVLPACYDLMPFDAMRLAERDVRTVCAPLGCEPRDCLRDLDPVADTSGGLYILFGSTLVEPGDRCAGDPAAPSGRSGPAEAARAEASAEKFGLFHFADPLRFCMALDQAASFSEAVGRYGTTDALSPIGGEAHVNVGIAESYYRAAPRRCVSRSGNRIVSRDRSVVKTGRDARKILGEAGWFQQAPPALRRYLPELLDVRRDRPSYELERIELPLLSDVYCLSALPFTVWPAILGTCLEFVEAMGRVPRSTEQCRESHAFFQAMIERKTAQRLEQLAESTCIDPAAEWRIGGRLRGSLDELSSMLVSIITPTTEKDMRFCHGDLHFGNIFYDTRRNRIRVIDPRGITPHGSPLYVGDARYDLAKLCHSIVGLYDNIVSDRYTMQWDGRYSVTLDLWQSPLQSRVIEHYRARCVAEKRCVDQEILALTALLFLSMAALHGESRGRQVAMLANAFRLADMAEAWR